MKVVIYIIFIILNFSNSVMSEELDDRQQSLYQSMIQEVRCLVCQNQSVAESNAELAKDLRNQIFQQILEGKTKNEIKVYLLNRYGDFILYQPVFNEKTLFLWLSPAILLLFLIGWYRKIRN